MKKIRAFLVSLPLVAAILFSGLAPASAAQFGPPSSDPGVHYYNCKGPYYTSNLKAIYYCYADWDWISEVFYGRRDGYIYVNAIYYA